MKNRQSRISQLITLSTLLVCLFTGVSLAYAIDIEESIWGFSNAPVKSKCVPLSLRISNNSPDPFDEFVQLNRLQYGTNSKVGAPLIRRIYLAPFSSQWVQFYPYLLTGQNENWSLNWGPGGLNYRNIPEVRQSYTENNSVQAAVSRVILANSNTFSQGGSQFKRFPEELFPPYVTATDALDEVILEHVPRWDAARRTSFHDWLVQGGVLHLLPDNTGKNLEFTSTLTDLNAPLDQFRVGAGFVIRHDLKLSQLSPQVLSTRMAEVLASEDRAITGESTSPGPNQQKNNTQNYDSYNYSDVNTGLLYQLSEMTQPEHNWSIIYVMTLVYITLIFPGCFLYHQRHKTGGYRNSLQFILIIVGLFSTIFWSIGKRGYGEKTTINSLMLARPLDNNNYDLTCWMNCFVTSGDKYQFTTNGEGTIFTTAQATEKVRGAIFNGIEGQFLSDIPPFSSRRFMYRLKAALTQPKLTIRDYQIETQSGETILTSLTLELDAPLPEDGKQPQILYGSYLYPLVTTENNKTILQLGKERTQLTQLQSAQRDNVLYVNRVRLSESNRTQAEIYDSFHDQLILKEIDSLNSQNLSNYQRSQARLKLFVYSEIPDALKINTSVQGIQQGRVLFAYDLALPEDKK